MTAVQRFRKRPGLVEAIQWHGESNCAEVYAFLGIVWPHCEPDHSSMSIPTLEGPVTATPGYWIVRGAAGEFWPVRADRFAETYEPSCAPEPAAGVVTREVTRLSLTDALRAVLPFSVDPEVADKILAALPEGIHHA